MKTLTKLALVSAMAISANAMAAQMQSLDDEALSAATGQDGITITLGNNISMDYLAIVDTDGGPATAGTAPNDIATGLTGTRAAIVIGDKTNGLTVTPTGNIVVNIDADGNAGAPLLNIGIDMGNTTIDVGAIRVAVSDATGANLSAVAGEDVSILNVGTVTLNNLVTNIQLGNYTATHGGMIRVKSNITGGLQLSDVSLVGKTITTGPTPPPGEYGLGLGAVTVTSTGLSDLNLDLTIGTTYNGLVISGLTAMDIAADNLRVGHLATGAVKMGNLYIKNLDLGNSITVAGH